MNTHYPHIIVYDASRGENSVTKSLVAPRIVQVMYGLLRGALIGFLVLFVVATTMFLYPYVREEIMYQSSRVTQEKGDDKTSAIHLQNLEMADQIVAVQKEARDYGVGSYFSVVIPKINASADVVPNVDAGDKLSYEKALKEGVAHAKGTYFPGHGKNIYLFSHSTNFDFNVSRYNAVFYMLRKLEPGDSVIVYFADKRYDYVVQEKLVVPASDTHYLTDETSEEVLYLQTCDPPGTTWKRLIVKAVRV